MRPPKKDGNPTVVYFHVTVMGLDSIDENSMTYAADIFFAQTWKDNRLRLPENMTSEYRLLEVEWLKNMWRPDSFFKNAKAVTFQTMTIPNHYMWLYKDKTILYMVKLTLTLSCAMNFMIYPHDTQECKLQMESLSHTTDDMIFQWDPDVPLVVDENIELPQLQLVKNNTADCTQVYSTGNFTCLEVVFVLKRRLGYYLFHTYIPTCLIVIMSWVSFWIKPEAAPARVTLGVTSLLTLSTQHAKSQASLPPVSYLKAVDAFMSACTVFVFMALMEYCLVNIVLGDSDLPQKPPEPLKPDKIFDLAAKLLTRGVMEEGKVKHTYSRTSRVRREITKALRCYGLKEYNQFKEIQSSSETSVGVRSGSLDGRPPQPSQAQRNRSRAISTAYKRTRIFTISMCLLIIVQQNARLLTGQPPVPPRPSQAQRNRSRAINIDRFSRVFFPLLFFILNCSYWVKFAEFL
ncbi:hypothetical protein J6590_066404 [Homalodisca vitripennis]|nr:hypothetical protein J6590_066404 [Homalodisca vitripennis]